MKLSEFLDNFPDLDGEEDNMEVVFEMDGIEYNVESVRFDFQNKQVIIEHG